MALMHGKEQYAHVVVTAGDQVMHRRIHKIRIHPSGQQPYNIEGKDLPNFVHVCTDKDADGKKVVHIKESPGVPEFKMDHVAMFYIGLAITFGGCVVIVLQAIEAATYM